MLGSYAPGQIYEKKFPLEEAPSGMVARAKYNARSRFTDDDGRSYLDFEWSFEVYATITPADSVDQEELGVAWFDNIFKQFLLVLCCRQDMYCSGNDGDIFVCNASYSILFFYHLLHIDDQPLQ